MGNKKHASTKETPKVASPQVASPVAREVHEHQDSHKPVFAEPDNHHGLTSAEAAERLKKYGPNALPEKVTPGWLVFLKCMWGPMPIALWIAAIVEFALESWPDAGILLAMQFANATIGWYESTKAGDAVAALKKSLKPVATVMRDGKWQEIDASLIVPGDKVKLASGSAVPADCSINEEPQLDVVPQIDVDEAALTGESLPVTMCPKDFMAKMGSTVVRGEVDGTVQYTGTNTVFGRTALLLASVENELGNIHYVLVKVMYGLTALSAILCIVCFIYLMVHLKLRFREALQFTVVLLIVSIPIAIEIVVTTTLALGSRELSLKKVIVTRLSSIEMMAAVNMLCSDKTGTLTLNKMEIQQECPTYMQGENLESVLVLAALAAKWREPPRDALDTMVLGAANLERCDDFVQVEFKPFDPRIKRTEATLHPKGQAHEMFRVTKGAPNIVLDLCANKDQIRSDVEKVITDLGRRGVRCLAVARTIGDGGWYMAGILTFLDPPRPDTKKTIHNAKKYGVDVKMVTGDHQLIAKEMARMLDLGTNIATAAKLPHFPESGDPKDIPDTLGRDYGDYMLSCDGFAQVHPEHKYLIVEALRQRGFVCAMTGDGVNDAPALKRADVGVAVHGSTDAARAAADMVLTEPGLSVIVDAMLIARGVFQRMESFLTYRVAATLQILFFFFIGVFALPPSKYGVQDRQFFNLPVLMLMLITLLNDGTLMAIGYDNVVPQKRPMKWNLPLLFFMAAILGGVACISSLLLLWMMLDAHWQNNCWWLSMGLPRLQYEQIITAVYLKISIGDFLTLFSCRTGAKPFFAFAPSKILLVGACLSLMISTIVAIAWQRSSPDDIETLGLTMMNGDSDKNRYRHILLPLFIWYWCIVWWFIQDSIKILAYKCVARYRARVERREQRALRRRAVRAPSSAATEPITVTPAASNLGSSVPVPVALKPIPSVPSPDAAASVGSVALVSTNTSSPSVES